MTAESHDRTVHAGNQLEQVVRYDRAGKWYLERLDGGRRRHVSVKEAAAHALRIYNEAGTIIFGKPGGSTFDRLVHNPHLQERPCKDCDGTGWRAIDAGTKRLCKPCHGTGWLLKEDG